jgi:leucyl aminopeptidase
MRFSDASPSLSVTIEPPARLDTDVVIVAAFEGEPPALPAGLDAAVAARVAQAFQSGEFTGKPYTTFMTPASGGAWRSPRLMVTGLGPHAAWSLDRARRWAAASASAARERKLTRAAFVLPGGLDSTLEAQAVAEGVTLAAFHAGIYKNDPAATPAALEPSVVASVDAGASALADLERAVARGYVLGACSNVTRALVNEPANRMTPRLFAEAADKVLSASGLAMDVLNEERLLGLGMGLLLAVARGSAEPPRVIVLRYDPADAIAGTTLGLVGKGVTFDSGGLSIKTAEGMQKMKTDMAGAAAVLGAMKAIAALQPRVRVIAVLPLVENMPGGTALRPGDVVRGAGGQTVEILDTDAEGRLILADALWYAANLGATHLVDVATLTGACAVALGRTTSGVFGAPENWVHAVQRASERAGDRTWAMPVFDDYKEQLRSEIADLTNIGTRYGGAITAAVFLKEFTSGLPWAHLDIAGTAWADEVQPYQPKGPTGVAVRTLAQLALAADEWAPPAAGR